MQLNSEYIIPSETKCHSQWNDLISVMFINPVNYLYPSEIKCHHPQWNNHTNLKINTVFSFLLSRSTCAKYMKYNIQVSHVERKWRKMRSPHSDLLVTVMAYYCLLWQLPFMSLHHLAYCFCCCSLLQVTPFINDTALSASFWCGVVAGYVSSRVIGYICKLILDLVLIWPDCL